MARASLASRPSLPRERENVLPALFAGVLIALIDLPVEVSFAALIFAGPLAPYFANGVGYLLAGAVVVGAVTALLSSYLGIVSLPQDTSVVIVSFMAASVVGAMAGTASDDAMLMTVLVIITLSSLLTALAFLAVGLAKRGDLVRYVPYPVIGGFLAGTGWLLLAGGLGIMTGSSVDIRSIPALLSPQQLSLWLPGLAFAVVLFLILRRFKHITATPLVLLGALLAFYAWLRLAGMTVLDARSAGLLMEAFPEGRLWHLPPVHALLQVDWPLVAAQAGQFVSLVIISVLSLLLNASGLELATRKPVDFNRELRAAGAANIAAGLVISPPGFTVVSLTVFGRDLGAHSRLLGIALAGTMGAVLLFGAPLLSLFPTFLMGGLVAALGLAFLVEWLVEGWSRLSPGDMGVVAAITASMALWGPLPGVAMGLALAVVQFILRYSRLTVIRHELSGRTARSKVERPHWQKDILRARADLSLILELQGVIFFGTAKSIVDQLERRLRSPEQTCPRFLVLDFRRVRDLDASAILTLTQIGHLCEAKKVTVICTGMRQDIQERLQRAVTRDPQMGSVSLDRAESVPAVLDSDSPEAADWRFFPDLDHGLEWCEEQLLSMSLTDDQETPLQADPGPRVLPSILSVVDFPLDQLAPYMERLELAAGHTLIKQGDPPQGLLYVESGRITVVLNDEYGQTIRLRTGEADTIVGEIGAYLGLPATASVVADVPSVVHRLPIGAVKRLEVEDPALAQVLHRYVICLLGGRLVYNLEYIRALSR